MLLYQATCIFSATDGSCPCIFICYIFLVSVLKSWCTYYCNNYSMLITASMQDFMFRMLSEQLLSLRKDISTQGC